MVQTVESLLPTGSSGAQKLALVQTMLTEANTVSSEVIADFSSIWPAISGIITSLVATYNAIGLFRTSSTPSTGPTPTTVGSMGNVVEANQETAITG